MEKNEIKQYKQILVIELKDGTILRSEKGIDELLKYLASNEFCFIDGVIFSKYEFKKSYVENLDELETLILSLPVGIQTQLRLKQQRLKKELNKEMTLDYAKNFISERLKNENRDN